MKQIIVPTDFSENAFKAAILAVSLAEDINATVSLLHAYQGFQSGFQSDKTNLEDENRSREEAEREMDLFVKKLRESNQIDIEGKCVEGTLLSAIERIEDDQNKTIIVMGTTGAKGLKYHLIGSNTLYIAKRTDLPLFTVPFGTEHFKLKKIAVFTDYKEEDKKNLANVITIFGSSELSYQLFHIHESDTAPQKEDFEKLEKWAEELKSICGIKKLTFELIEGKENAALVDEIVERGDIDLLTLTMLEQNFWDNLFEKSLAKAIILQGKAPVFIQH
ncbi:MAG: universal stress protein [Ginsengibacter sp.]